jgi:hypothetical protein
MADTSDAADLPLDELADLMDLGAAARRAGRGPKSWPELLNWDRRRSPARWRARIDAWSAGWASEDVLLQSPGTSREAPEAAH